MEEQAGEAEAKEDFMIFVLYSPAGLRLVFPKLRSMNAIQVFAVPNVLVCQP